MVYFRNKKSFKILITRYQLLAMVKRTGQSSGWLGILGARTGVRTDFLGSLEESTVLELRVTAPGQLLKTPGANLHFTLQQKRKRPIRETLSILSTLILRSHSLAGKKGKHAED